MESISPTPVCRFYFTKSRENDFIPYRDSTQVDSTPQWNTDLQLQFSLFTQLLVDVDQVA